MKAIKLKIGLAIYSIFALTACDGESSEAKRLGFSSVDEMKEIHANGWHTKKRYEEDTASSLGYSSVSEFKSAELKIKKQKEFEENWKEKGTHRVMVTCFGPFYTLAENAMLMLMRFGPESFANTVNNNAFSRACILGDPSVSYKKWDEYNERVKILGIKEDAIFWYALVVDKKSSNVAIGVGGMTIYSPASE